MKPELLSIKKITKTWNQAKPSIQINDLNINQGTLTILTGNNGAGKSTILNIISGGVDADHQLDITWLGNKKQSLLAGKDLSYLPQKPYIFDTTVAKNIAFVLQNNQRNLNEVEEIMSLLKLPKDLRNQNAKQLSAGMQKRLSLAQIYATNAPLILLDEANNDLDQEGITVLNNLLTKMLSTNKSIILAIQNENISRIENIDNTIDLSK